MWSCVGVSLQLYDALRRLRELTVSDKQGLTIITLRYAESNSARAMRAMIDKGGSVVGSLDVAFDLEDSRLFRTDSESPLKLKKLTIVKEQRDTVRRSTQHLEPFQHGSVQSSWNRQIERAVRNCCQYYLQTQHPEGYWWSELESNVTITSEYVMFRYLLGLNDSGKNKKIAAYLLNRQRPNGSWELYYEDGGDLSTTVEAYFALKLAGEDPESEPMIRARHFILRHGGVEASRVFTKIWLALFSQYDWDQVPSMPVELVLLPPSFYFNIYEFSMWARGTAVPLSVVLAIRPRYTLPPEHAIAELHPTRNSSGAKKRFASPTHQLFYYFDRIAKFFERHPIASLRNRAVDAAERWILEHQEETGDWGGIQPAMINSVLALHYLGYPLDHPIMVRGMKAIEDFCMVDEEGFRMQSCLSPVWDTALTALALLEAGISPDHPQLKSATDWLVKNQVSTGGDWQIKNPSPPGGWAFEFTNNFYPDVDDSAVVLQTLHRMCPSSCNGVEATKQRGMAWCLSMQCSSGGWAAFDKDNDLIILNRIPFADQEAMVDYATADVTGRMLEAMGLFGFDRSHPRAERGIKFLRSLQEEDGSWWGRWGVNYIYGTWSALRGLISIGEDPRDPHIRAAVQWIKDQQNEDGGWGETCESYSKPELRGQGPSTPSQTAWALMALIVCHEHNSTEVQRGIQYLIRTQKSDGTWDEKHFTGTGFPKHFFIRYHNYRNCFPLMALGQYLKKLKEEDNGV